jgi:serine/threonine-protein kinase
MQAGVVDTRADIWALGAILYEALGGRPAFGAETLPAVCAKVLGEQPPALREHLPNVPDALEALVFRCLSKDPNQRYATIGDLAADLHRFGSGNSLASFRRVHAIVTGSSVVPSGAGPLPPTHMSTGPTVLADPGLSDSAKGTAKAVSMVAGETRGRSGGGSGALAVVGVLGLILVGGGGTAAWMFLRTPTGTEDPAAAAASIESTVTQPEAAETVDQPATEAVPPPSATTAPTIADAGAADGEAQSEEDSKQTPAAAKKPRVGAAGPKSRPHRPAPRPAPKAPTPRGDAWDPGNFGGRH